MDNCLEKIRSKVNNKKTVIGTHIHLKEHNITEMMGDAGFEFVWIDMEHSALDKELVQNHLIAGRASGLASFVRIPWNDPIMAKPIPTAISHHGLCIGRHRANNQAVTTAL